jgi:hypothetical protein
LLQHLSHDDDDAAFSLDQAQRLTFGRHPEGHLHQGLLRAKQGRWDTAKDAFESARQFSVEGSDVHAKARANLATLDQDRAQMDHGGHKGVDQLSRKIPVSDIIEPVRLTLELFLDGQPALVEFDTGSHPETVAKAFFLEHNIVGSSTAPLVEAIDSVIKKGIQDRE